MFGEISAPPSIDEPKTHRRARPEPASRSIPDRIASVSDLLAEPRGVDFNAAVERPLPVPASAAPAPIRRGRRTGPLLPIGILLYLATVGIVAAVTVGVLFGIGFSLLVQPTDAMSAGAATRTYGSDIELLLSSIVSRFFGDPASAGGKVVPVPIRLEVPRSAAVAALPAAPAAQQSVASPTSPPERSGAVPTSAVGNADANEVGRALPGEPAKPPEEPVTTNDAAAAVSPAAGPPSSYAPGAVTSPPASDLPTVDIAEFLSRGDSYLRIGDVTSARLFYERAADAGSGQGAMRLGATFDPNFLSRAGIVGTRGDQTKADTWYRRARGLGAAEAAREPKGRETK